MSVRLPSVDESSERLLEGYASPLLAALARHEPAAAVSRRLSQSAAVLRNVLRSRELCERLSVHADALAESAERALEAEVRALYGALSRRTRERMRLFPSGLGATLAPRGNAQVGEATRLLLALEGAGAEVSAKIAVRLGLAIDALAARLSTSAAAHASLLQVVAAEHRQRRAFREQYHAVYGALLGLFADEPRRASSFFKQPNAPAPKSTHPPAAPPRVSSFQPKHAKQTKGRKKR